MMYRKNFVAAVKIDGKILRESSDRVELPFGSEYSILLKNLDSVRVRTSIQIDGQDAVNGVVIQPNSEIEIERFLRNSGSLDQGNRFKFIERTAAVENHRGIKADDGLIRIEFEREKVYQAPKVVEHHTYHHHTSWPYSGWPYVWSSNNSNVLRGQTVNSSSRVMGASNYSGPIAATMALNSSSSGVAVTDMYKYAEQNQQSAQQNDQGITVEGSLSSQRFVPVQGFECEQAEVVVLHLVGRNGLAPIQVAKTVRAKLSCETCGTKNKSSSKFCKECGTSLEKV